MRKLVVAGCSALVLVAVLIQPAGANTSSSSTNHATSSKLTISARITRFRATAAGVVGDGILSGKLKSGSSVSRDTSKVTFKAVAKPRGNRCNVLTLRLAPLDLELLGAQVQTSHISLDVYALHGRVLGDLFCGLSHAKVTFPRSASVARALNRQLDGHSLHVFTASDSFGASAAQTTTGAGTTGPTGTTGTTGQPQSCQVLKLVLGPLHLDLLGLVIDLYGKTHADPVVVTINAIPSEGILGQLLCGLAGGGGVSSISQLQSLLSSLGVALNPTQIQDLLNQLGITDLSSGLTQTDLNRILQALGLGSTPPAV